jgi:predicted alpha/beta-fold hydrolase
MNSYHNISDISDIKQTINHFYNKIKDDKGRIIAIGYSLGSNMLLKYLGTVKEETPINLSFSISNPFDLSRIQDSITNVK